MPDHPSLSIDDLQEVAQKFASERNWDQNTGKDIAIGVITEASEILEHFRFISESEMDVLMQEETKRSEVGDELADTLYFLLRLSEKYHINLTQAFLEKMKKNEVRFPIQNI